MTTREGMTEDDGDFVEHLFTATTHDYLDVLHHQRPVATSSGFYEIPEMGRASKGRSIANILELRSEEKIAATIVSRVKRPMKRPGAQISTFVFRHAQRYRQEIDLNDFKKHPQRRIIVPFRSRKATS